MSALDNPTLVLNRNWQPIDAIPARDALSDAIAEKARIICPDTFQQFDMGEWMEHPIPHGVPTIQSVRSLIRVPEVIINEYKHIPQREVHFSRRNLWKRDGFRCQYCGVCPPSDEITVDHVVPKSRGGRTVFENTVLACIDCNKKKDNRTPEQAGMRLRKIVKNKDGTTRTVFYDRPKRPSWSPMFAVRRLKMPKSWSKFLAQMIDDLYWNSELED